MECGKFFDVGTSEKYDLSRFSFIDNDITDGSNSFRPEIIPDSRVEKMRIR